MGRKSDTSNGYGKTDLPRKVDGSKYRRNYVRIYGEKCPYCNGEGVLVDGLIGTICMFCKGKGRIYDIDKID